MKSRIFSVYLRGCLWAPVPMQNSLFYPKWTKKIPNQKIVVFNNYSIFFHLDVLCFNLESNDINCMTTCNSRHPLQKIRNIFI